MYLRAQNDQPIRSGATVQHPEPFTAGASAGVSDAGTWPLKPRQRICKWWFFHIYVPLYTRFIYHYIIYHYVLVYLCVNLYTANIMTQILEKKSIQGDEKQSACGPAGQAGAAAMAPHEPYTSSSSLWGINASTQFGVIFSLKQTIMWGDPNMSTIFGLNNPLLNRPFLESQNHPTRSNHHGSSNLSIIPKWCFTVDMIKYSTKMVSNIAIHEQNPHHSWWIIMDHHSDIVDSWIIHHLILWSNRHCGPQNEKIQHWNTMSRVVIDVRWTGLWLSPYERYVHRHIPTIYPSIDG